MLFRSAAGSAWPLASASHPPWSLRPSSCVASHAGSRSVNEHRGGWLRFTPSLTPPPSLPPCQELPEPVRPRRGEHLLRRPVLLDPALVQELGRRGAAYYRTHYSWPVIERTYMDTFAQLSNEPAPSAVAPRTGWLERRRRDRPAAAAVVNALPKGPVHPDRSRPRP